MVEVGVLVTSQSTDIFNVVRDSVGVMMVLSQWALSNRGRPSNRMDMYHFLKLFRASICLCGGESREQFRWIVKWMDGQVTRSMDDNGRRINVMSIKKK